MFRVKRDIFVYIDDAKRIGECRYDAIVSDSQRWIIVLTELRANPGPSITNAMEYIIDQFCQQNGLSFPDEVDFLERYESHPDYLDIVRIRPAGTDWSRMPDEEAKPILELLK